MRGICRRTYRYASLKMSKSEDLTDYSDSYIPTTVGYIRGMVNTLGLFYKKEWHRQYCTIDIVDLAVEEKNKIIQERSDGVATQLFPTEDYITGVVERSLIKYFDERCAEIDQKFRSEGIEETWRYLIWRIAEYIMFIEEPDYVKSCLKEKSIIKSKDNKEDGVFYCLTINSKYLVLIKLHDVKAPQEEIDEYLKASEEYKKCLKK